MTPTYLEWKKLKYSHQQLAQGHRVQPRFRIPVCQIPQALLSTPCLLTSWSLLPMQAFAAWAPGTCVWGVRPASKQGILNTSAVALIQGRVGGGNLAWSWFFVAAVFWRAGHEEKGRGAERQEASGRRGGAGKLDSSSDPFYLGLHIMVWFEVISLGIRNAFEMKFKNTL